MGEDKYYAIKDVAPNVPALWFKLKKTVEARDVLKAPFFIITEARTVYFKSGYNAMTMTFKKATDEDLIAIKRYTLQCYKDLKEDEIIIVKKGKHMATIYNLSEQSVSLLSTTGDARSRIKDFAIRYFERVTLEKVL